MLVLCKNAEPNVNTEYLMFEFQFAVCNFYISEVLQNDYFLELSTFDNNSFL